MEKELEKEMICDVDVDVFLTEDSPDTKEDVLTGPLDTPGSPIRGPYIKMCPTFRRLEQIAVECGGGWENWEPYRCTYHFNSEDQCDMFIDISKNEFDHILIEKKIWKWSKNNK